MNMRQIAARVVAAGYLCLALCFPSWAAAADADDIAELKRAIEALQAENRALAERLATLEAQKSEREQAVQSEHAQKKVEAQSQPTRVESKEQEQLEQRVKELENAQAAQEQATRSIIRDSVAKMGSKINESVSLNGTLEVLYGRSKDFSGASQNQIQLNTAELDFEIQANPWVLGSLALLFSENTNPLFPSTVGFQTTSNQVNVDTASITIGDTQKFPAFVKTGRVVLPFGISTGSPWADVLSIVDPLTIEVFQMKNTALGFGLAFPTPALAPTTPPVTVPPVKPQVINPLISSLSKLLGYESPPTRPKPPTPITPTPAPPPFNAGVYFYQGNTGSPTRNINASLGYRTKGHCGRPYDELRASDLCPWSIDIGVDYNSSVFNSTFLEDGYAAFLNQIGLVQGMAASVKSTLGPISLVAEWNGAISQASFVDDRRRRVNIKPAAWQVSLGYQFDWNPWVESIGAQGTYLAVGYSQSHDLAGVTQVINRVPTRVGFAPERRLLLTAGEWVLESLKLAIEYSYNWDYSKLEGGTGNTAKGIFTSLTYVW